MDDINEAAVISAFLQHKNLSLEDFEAKNIFLNINVPANGNRRTILFDIIQKLQRDGKLILIETHPDMKWKFNYEIGNTSDILNKPTSDPFDTEKERTTQAKSLLQMLFEYELIPEFDGYQEWILIRQLPVSQEEKNRCIKIQDLARRIMYEKGYAREHPQFNMESILTESGRELYKHKTYID